MSNARFYTLVGAVLVGLLMVLAMAMGTKSHTNAPQNIPSCTHEDGSGQAVCDWNDKSGDHVVNFGHGRYQYNITRNTMHDWTNE